MASYGIIYATGSKMVRRIISGSSNLAAHVGPNESLLTVQQLSTPNVFEAEAAVQAATGVKPASIQCAIVNGSGAVVDIVKADPAIDTVDKHTLVPTYAGVTKDCTYSAASGLFTAPIVVVKAGTVLKDGTVTKVDTQTGGVLANPAIATVDATADTLA